MHMITFWSLTLFLYSGKKGEVPCKSNRFWNLRRPRWTLVDKGKQTPERTQEV